MNIGIGQIRLSFPLNLTIRDVKVITPSRHVIVTRKFPSQHPSAATAEKEVLVDAIDLRGVKAIQAT